MNTTPFPRKESIFACLDALAEPQAASELPTSEIAGPAKVVAAVATGSGLSCNQADILQHTSRTGRYCSDEEPDLIALASRGLLHDHGAQAIAGGMHYYTPTPAGRAALNAHRLTGQTKSRQPESNNEVSGPGAKPQRPL